MGRLRGTGCGLLLLGLLIPVNACAQPTEPEVLVDRFGDPLPPGAVARFGTDRLRHGTAVTAVCFSPDGKWLASAADDDTVKIWDAAKGSLEMSLPVDKRIYSLSFLNQTTLAVGTQSVELWDLDTQRVQRIVNDRATTTALDCNSDGTLIATCDTVYRGVRLWEVETGKPIAELSLGRYSCRTVQFSPDGTLVAAGATSSRIGARNPVDPVPVAVWDTTTGEMVLEFLWEAGSVTSVAISPDNEYLATVSPFTLGIWELSTGKKLYELKDVGDDVAFSTDGKYVGTCSSAGGSVWVEVISGEIIHAFADRERSPHGRVVAFSPSSPFLAVGHTGGRIRLWDVTSGNEINPQTDVHAKPIIAAAISPTGEYAFTGSEGESIIRMWRTVDGEQVKIFQIPGAEEYLQKRNKPKSPTHLAVSPHRSLLAIAATDLHVYLWDWDSETVLGDFASDDRGIIHLTFSQTGQCLACTGTSRGVSIWDVHSGERVALLDIDSKTRPPFGVEIDSIAWSPDHQQIAIAAKTAYAFRDRGNQEDQPPVKDTITVWEVETGNHIHTLPDSEGHGWQLTWSPTGSLLAATGTRSGVRLWGMPSGELMGSGSVGARSVPIAFSPSEDFIAVAAWPSGSVTILEVGTLREVVVVSGHAGGVRRIEWLPDTKRLISTGSDASALVWNLTGGSGSPADQQRRN